MERGKTTSASDWQFGQGGLHRLYSKRDSGCFPLHVSCRRITCPTILGVRIGAAAVQGVTASTDLVTVHGVAADAWPFSSPPQPSPQRFGGFQQSMLGASNLVDKPTRFGWRKCDRMCLLKCQTKLGEGVNGA